MAGYSVDVDALSDLQAEMSRFISLCTEKLPHVEHLIGTVSAAWDGTAAAAYQQRHSEWLGALREMREAVTEFDAWAAASEEAYRTVMAMNLRMAGQ